MKEIYLEIVSIARQMWRYRMHGLAMTWLVAIVGVVLVTMQRDVYESTARVYVNTASQLRMLLGEQIVESNVEDQLRYVREAMLGRPHLTKLAKTVGVLNGSETIDEVAIAVNGLANNIQIVSNADLSGPRRRFRQQTAEDTYLIRYQAFDRGAAISVVEELLNIFMEDTLGAEKSSSQVAGDFLKEQIQEYETRLQSAESALAEFNRRNYHRLPNLQGGYFQQLQQAQEELDESARALDLAKSRVRSLERQMRGESPRISAFRSSDGQLDPNSIEARVQNADRELSALKLRFTDEHPDVIAATQILRKLQAELEDLYSGEVDFDAPSNNPVFQALQISRNEAMSEVDTLAAVLQQRSRRVEELQALIGEVPEVEAELARLNRDYDVVNEKYQTLLASLERESLSREVVERGEMEFRVIDPPTAGYEPIAPRRSLFLAFVFVISAGAGLGTAYILSQVNLVFDSKMSLAKSVYFPILGAVSLSDHAATSGRALLMANLNFILPVALFCATISGVMILEIAGPGLRSLF